MQRKILVTGGAGFIGSHCVDALLARGDEVTVLDIRRRDDAVNLAHVRDRITYVEGDIRDRSVLTKTLPGHTHVLHLAAFVSVPRSIEEPVESHDTNVNGTCNVLETARLSGIERVVYASSAAVYGATEIVPTPESVPCAPCSPYALHKVINEEYAALYDRLYGLSTCGLRFFNVYGTRQDPSSPYSGVISIFAQRAREGGTPIVYGDGTATRDFVAVTDVAAACLAALDDRSSSGEVFNVGTGRTVSINELVTTIAKVAGCGLEVEYRDERVGDIARSCADIERLRSVLGCTPSTMLEEGLRELMDQQ